MRNSKITWFAAGALSVLLTIVLNPSPEHHRTSIKEHIAERSELAAALRLGDLAAFVSSYHSLGIASYTTVNERVMSIGALGMVFVPEQNSAE